jgi:hypothetical protein
MQSLHEVQRQFKIAFRSGANTVARPALHKTRAPLRQQGCSPLESHRGLKHEGIL